MSEESYRRRSDDGKFLKSHQALLSIIAMMIGCVVFIYSTFATVKYVDIRHSDVISKFSEIKSEMESVRSEIKETNRLLFEAIQKRDGFDRMMMEKR